MSDTRRRFMAHFAGAGLGATLAPGILWARMQEQGASRITLEMVTDALKLAGIESTEAERQSDGQRRQPGLDAIRSRSASSTFPNDVSPPFHFSALVPGIEVNKTRRSRSG